MVKLFYILTLLNLLSLKGRVVEGGTFFVVLEQFIDSKNITGKLNQCSVGVSFLRISTWCGEYILGKNCKRNWFWCVERSKASTFSKCQLACCIIAVYVQNKSVAQTIQTIHFGKL